ncbi:MAG TPA: DUF262 domain-containing HNH endonuclease family protein, partial [Bryobacteraceae bacterium]|nr:DUF262 domain-containing HNH endonuclease family protein [Bryobacteraceae bacterium]
AAIGHILQDRHLRPAVPLNQRSYAWKIEHVTELYSDWASAIAEGREEYFLGSLVVVKVGEATEVFDGQQRLATTMILVAAVRDYFLRHSDEQTARIIEEESLYSRERESHEQQPHFRLNAEDHEFFAHRVLARASDPERKAATKETPRRDSHKRIAAAADAAAKHVQNIVQALPASGRSKLLHSWLTYLEKSVKVILVEVADERTAFTIFETMNDRGLKLSAADLLKNYLFARAEERKAEAVQKWHSLTGVLESIDGEEDGIVEYIRFFWIAAHGPTRTKDLYDFIKRDVTNKTKAVRLATDLEATIHHYAAVLTSSHDEWSSYRPGVRAKISTLRQLGVTQIRPLLLAAFPKFSRKEMEKLLDACISWSVRSLLGGVPSGTLEGYYGRAAYAVTHGTATNVKALSVEMTKIFPDDKRFLAAVENVNVANANLARYYLRALQRQADGEKEPQYIPNEGCEITLEHIIPQKPGNNRWKHLTPDQCKANYNRLGNQVLLTGTINSKLGNEEFDVKKPALLASDYSLAREAGAHKSWGLDEIGAQQARLAELAVLTWPITFR